MQDDQLARMRARMAAENQFVGDRGGQRWLASYVLPFYRKWMGVGAGGAEAQALLPDVRDRARQLSIPDISAMVQMQWRVQVMGAWYAIARVDDALAGPVHEAFERCYGTLTAPALATAVLTYADGTTAEVLRSYRDRDLEHRYGASGIIDAALRRLETTSADASRTRDDDVLDGLLSVAERLQQPT
jgi:hypothetical protein